MKKILKLKINLKNKLSLFLTLALTSFVNSCSKKEVTKGKIAGLTYNKLIGHGWAAKAWYEYDVKVDLFKDTIYFYENEAIISPGTELIIEYEINNPKKNKIKN